MTIVVAHESEPIREAIRRLVSTRATRCTPSAKGKAALAALAQRPAALVLDVALPEVHAYEVVEEAKRRAPDTRVVLVASIYNRTGYKRRPTSLYGADDYVEQHHIPDALLVKLERLIGPAPRAGRAAAGARADARGCARSATRARSGLSPPPAALPSPKMIERARAAGAAHRRRHRALQRRRARRGRSPRPRGGARGAAAARPRRGAPAVRSARAGRGAAHARLHRRGAGARFASSVAPRRRAGS